MDDSAWLLAALVLVVATLYSSVGHAGASGYIAAMALVGFAPAEIRPTALALNVLVGGIGLVRFASAGLVHWRRVLPLVLASAPAAFLAARVQLPTDAYETVLGVVLLAAAVLVLRGARGAVREDAAAAVREVAWTPALLAGAGIGVLSGLTGTGGAIFLTPLLILLHWAPTRAASGISVAFVWINSVVALAGVVSATGTTPAALPLWLAAAAGGALVGSQLGVRWLAPSALRYALSLVLLVAAGKLLVF